MIDVAIAGGVTHFYPGEFGSDVGQDGLKDFRYFRDKRVTRNHLVAAAKKHENFRYTLMLTGVFTEWLAGPLYGVDIEKHTIERYGKPDGDLASTSVAE
jgi:hypothetical protein